MTTFQFDDYTNEEILTAIERSKKHGRHAEEKMLLRILHGQVSECPCSQNEQRILCAQYSNMTITGEEPE